MYLAVLYLVQRPHNLGPYPPDRAHEKAKNIVASIVADTNPIVERKSIRFAQDQEDMAQDYEDVAPDIGPPSTFLS